MARTFKAAWIKDRNPWAKNQAARTIRRLSLDTEIADGKAYRKFYNPWNISDWSWPRKEPSHEVYFHILGYWYRRSPEEIRKEWVRYKKLTGNRRALRAR